ncbi:MAG: hypothetical protein J3Q66DRAFT_356391 [Benniella sp.]|nr:MAG: hypothetical protein J3Q66DRAFT_356391 [Benniella sp.]
MKTSLSRRIVALAATIVTLISLSVTTTSAAVISGKVIGYGENPLPRDLSTRTRVVLSGGAYSAVINRDGKFVFSNVPEGSYLLEVQSPQYIYPVIKLTITDKQPRAHLVTLGADWSNNDNILPLPLTLSPRGPATFFIAREGFKISHLFANPMMLMMGFSVLMLFIMPKMMANMDPEAMQEVQGMHDSVPTFEMPDFAETLAKYTTGGGGGGTAAGSSQAKKR